MSFWNKLIGTTSEPEYGEKPLVPTKPKEPEKRHTWAKGAEAIAASKAATKEFEARAKEKFANFNPTQAAFRIRQTPEGSFVIERREQHIAHRADPLHTMRYMMTMYRSEDDYLPWADEIEKYNDEPYVTYETVKNDKAPIKTVEHSYGRSYYGDRERIVGYAPMMFNVFEDAEAYLFRMAQPAEVTTEYDFPPLKKRVVKRAKKDAE